MSKITQEQLGNPSELGGCLEEVIRRGARELIQKSIEAEVAELLASFGSVTRLGG